MTTVAATLRLGADTLAQSDIPDARKDAQRLMAHVLNVDATALLSKHDATVAAKDVANFLAMIDRRMAREPVSRILGCRAFWTSEFAISPDVLDPRPETETLVEAALAAPFSRVLDLGTGSGCILISLLQERIMAKGLGTDVSGAALEIAHANAARLGVGDRAEFRESDWFADVDGRFDLIVSNPPYIRADEMAGLDPEVREFDPRSALTDGADGLLAYQTIAAGAAERLSPGGRLLVEIGAMQGEAVGRIFEAAGLEIRAVHQDLGDRDRVVEAGFRAPKSTNLPDRGLNP